MAVIGHTAALATLSDTLPPVVLITGPEGVGKRRIAHHLGRLSGATGIDLQKLGSLNREKASAMIEHHRTEPAVSPVKCSVADLTYSSRQAVNALLHLLEEPPERSRIVLHTDRVPLLTVLSRSFQVRCGLLSTEEVRQVLVKVGAQHSSEAAEASQGRVSLALEYSSHFNVRLLLDGILDMLGKRDGKGLEDALHHALTRPDKMETEEFLARCEALRVLFKSALLSRQGVIGRVRIEKWQEALQIMDRPGRTPLVVRATAWTLVMGL